MMKLKKEIIPLLLIFVTFWSNCNLFGQNSQSRPTRQSSLEAFSKGNYEQAYNEFKVLLESYPRDPLYKYYSGVCLINLKKDPAEAEKLLQQSLQTAGTVRTLPSDAMFYLGRAQQMEGKFTEAIEAYNLCTEQIGKKSAKELKIPDYVQQCNQKQGKILPEIKTTGVVQNVVQNAENKQIPDSAVLNKPVTKPVKQDAAAKKNLPSGIDKILDDALEAQIKADSLTALVMEQRKNLDSLLPSERSALLTKISANESSAASFQKIADQKYKEARAISNPTANQTNQNQSVVKKDTLKQSVINPVLKQTGNQQSKIDSLKKIERVVYKPVEIFSIFEVLPKPVTDPKEKIKIDPEIPEGLIYRIQIAVFRNPVALSYFRGLSPIYGFKISGTDKTTYYAGMFRKTSDAAKALSSVKAKGFKDAFVVALAGNKTVSADRAAVMEKEWGNKPFMSILKPEPKMSADTIPPTLQFRVELTRSAKPLKEDVIEGFKKLAGSRGLDIQELEDGNIAYLIGKFITFESASEYADLLKRNGYQDSKVVAWLGSKEMPVETARQLFDKLK
jgi:tetratricopeptide (TPR) repeat protein